MLINFYNYEILLREHFFNIINNDLTSINDNNENFYIIFLLKLINNIKTKNLLHLIDLWLININEFRKVFNFKITINNFIIKLQLYELIIDKPLNLLLNKLIFNYINKRNYYDMKIIERDNNGLIANRKISTFAPINILSVINK